jgi:hypothetical protein
MRFLPITTNHRTYSYIMPKTWFSS